MLPIALLCAYLTVCVNEEPSINVVLTLLGLNDFSTKEAVLKGSFFLYTIVLICSLSKDLKIPTIQNDSH